MTEFTLRTWEEHFQPITNHLNPKALWQFDGPGTGIMFDDSFKELTFVQSQPVEQVWTYVDHNGNGTSIIPGFHVANRIGYFITKVSRSKDQENLVIVVTRPEDETSPDYYL